MPISKKYHNLWSEIFIEPRKKTRRYEDIDPKIAPLVSQLNAVTTIKTVASCQGHAFGRPEPPYVYFEAKQETVGVFIQAIKKPVNGADCITLGRLSGNTTTRFS